MSNTNALAHARRLHAHGIEKDKIKLFLRVMTTYAERREILASLDAPALVTA